ncbi:E2/UBC family protein [Halothiobacillus sp.]|uniref:E2/UBC family protein n=1 Tax=Halothiobacillus sp. TaxID=1891311 RepID=UPI0026310FB6|nr:E2/UBC family protein [Halothiobacillus sp.]MDD4965769.1 E2/UBC family protein [Halothiobacillus sp.]
MPLLLDTDYAELKERGLVFTEDEARRFLVLSGYPLPDGLYHQKSCDVLVIIPGNYNQGGIDMLWTHPRPTRIDGRAIPAVMELGSPYNHHFDGKEFCRWSRHWTTAPVLWRAGTDNVVTILRRIEWALNNPDPGVKK